MATRQTSPQETGAPSEQEALVGYQTAISLWTHEGAQNWSRFNMMLIVNSVLLIVLALSLTSGGRSQIVVSVILAVIGLVVSASWFLITRRSFDSQKYYARSAREIEETALAGRIQTVSRGSDFENGKPVTLTLNGKPITVRQHMLSGLLSAETGGLVIIGIFLGLNVLFTLLAVFQMLGEMF